MENLNNNPVCYEIRKSDDRYYVRFPRFDYIDKEHPVDMKITSFFTLDQAIDWIYKDQYENENSYPEYAGLPIYYNNMVITVKKDVCESYEIIKTEATYV